MHVNVRGFFILQTMTGSNGRPLESLTESQTAGPGGPITLQVMHFRATRFDTFRYCFNYVAFEGSSVYLFCCTRSLWAQRKLTTIGK